MNPTDVEQLHIVLPIPHDVLDDRALSPDELSALTWLSVHEAVVAAVTHWRREHPVQA